MEERRIVGLDMEGIGLECPEVARVGHCESPGTTLKGTRGQLEALSLPKVGPFRAFFGAMKSWERPSSGSALLAFQSG